MFRMPKIGNSGKTSSPRKAFFPSASARSEGFPTRRRGVRNIRRNLVFAFAYNVAGIPIAAGALYPATGMLLSPAIAAAAMALSSASVIGHSLRLRAVRL